MKILIAGTPCTGKTTLAKSLSQKLKLEHIDLSDFIESQSIYSNYNKELDTYEFSAKKVRKALEQYLKDMTDFIIDTHCVSAVKYLSFDHVFVLRVPNDILYKRLFLRKYSEDKIRENIECEIFGVVEEDCRITFHNKVITIIESDNSTPPDYAYKKAINKILS